MTTPSTLHLAVLADLSDAELLAPLLQSQGQDPAPAMSEALPPRHVGTVIAVPSLDDLMAQADAVVLAQNSADLPARTPRVTAVPAGEQVSPSLRGNGGRLSDALRQVVGENIKTADDLRYMLRVLASHAVNSLIGNRYSYLTEQERATARTAHDDWNTSVLAAVRGEVAAAQAAEHLTPEEFTFLLELIDSNRRGMAQNLAGADVDVAALAEGRGLDWRALAESWTEACASGGSVTFEAGKNAAGWCSYALDVAPQAGWVLSVYVDQAWVPIEASPAGLERARAARQQVLLERSQAAKPAPYLGTVFADKLLGAA